RRFFQPTMATQTFIARNLAAAFLSGVWTLDGLRRRGAEAWGRRDRRLRPMIHRLLARFADPAGLPTLDLLAKYIAADEGFQSALRGDFRDQRLPVGRIYWLPPTTAPTPGAPATCQLPASPTSTAP